MGFHTRTTMFKSSSLHRHMCPSHWILCPLIKLTTDAISIPSCSSLLYFFLHVSFSLSYVYWSKYYPQYFVLKSSKFFFGSVCGCRCFTSLFECRSDYCWYSLALVFLENTFDLKNLLRAKLLFLLLLSLHFLPCPSYCLYSILYSILVTKIINFFELFQYILKKM